MRRPPWIDVIWPPQAEGQAGIAARRDRLAVMLAIATFVCVVAAFLLTKGTRMLMPGPLASAHGAIEKCSACHTKSGTGKLSFVHGLVAGDPEADSKACLTCHKMPDTAFNAHGASADVLEASTLRLTKIASQIEAPPSARAQSIAFPTHAIEERGLFCATCHQDHQGVNFNLSRISNEQCRSCHVVQFDSFDGRHPKFESFPFKRRTRIVFDHAGHFGKHYPEVVKKDPARRIPDTCSTCHDSRADKRVMAVAPFEKTCSGCHLDQIVGKERASGPKGIAFLSLPGLDTRTLKKKNAAIGEWQDSADAELTPFMKVMISRTKKGRALIKTVDSLNLQDLSNASDAEIKAVTALAWEVKGLLHALIKGKASDVLGNLNIGGGAKLAPNLVADLTASIPRDVVVSAQQQWLPNLATEMAARPPATEEPEQNDGGGWNTVTTESRLEGSSAPASPPGTEAGANPAPSPEAVDGQAVQPEGSSVKTYTTQAGPEDGAPVEGGDGPIKKKWLLPSGTPRMMDGRNKPPQSNREDDSDRGGRPAASEPDAGNTNQPEGAAAPDAANAPRDAGGPPQASEQPQAQSGEQTDDLLSPTPEELRAIEAKGAAPAAAPSQGGGGVAERKPDSAGPQAGPSGSDAAAGAAQPATEAQPRAPAPVVAIESDVDPESWAEYGGWYRQDFAIYYRPVGHKDKFVYSWLYLTGPQAPKGGAGPVTAVFDVLTGKDAQGSCTKCHSIDDIAGKGRLVNFAPPSVRTKQGRFTKFVHEPHFGIMEDRGCLTCHSLEKERPYLKSYEQGNPQVFTSNFGEVKKKLCQSCHTTGMARQDCLLCHDYHVNGVITPIMTTKLPTQ